MNGWDIFELGHHRTSFLNSRSVISKDGLRKDNSIKSSKRILITQDLNGLTMFVFSLESL